MMYFVYILSNKPYGSLYVGITNNLIKRVWQHKEKFVDGFTKEYHLDKLVYYECTSNVLSAIQREKQLKAWHRDWKLHLISKTNPSWKDLYAEICGKQDSY